VGREYLLPELTAVEVPRRVLVIGAGPAGLAVARMAALRGHDVVVCDVNERIGGMVRLAAVPPKRAELSELVEYYERELARLQVEVRLSTPVDRQLMESVQPEVVVVATGAQPEIPQIDGLYDTEMDLSTVVDVLSGAAELGDRVVVLGGNQAGLATADHLAEQGKEVTVLHRDAAFAPEMPVNDRFSLRQRLRQGGVKLFKNVVIREFLPHGVVFESKGDAVTLDAVSDIVISEGMRSDRTVANLVKQFDVEVYVIGDAKSPRNLLHSQSEADEVGRAI
jgi:NADPH-dependent 2,4-dienoyl-CoA reductase/sulfur reductase-like enzyme